MLLNVQPSNATYSKCYFVMFLQKEPRAAYIFMLVLLNYKQIIIFHNCLIPVLFVRKDGIKNYCLLCKDWNSRRFALSDPFKKCNFFFIHVVLGRIKKWLLYPQHKCVYHRHTAGYIWGKLQTLHPRNETCLVFIEKNLVTVWQTIYSKYAGWGTL